MKQFFAWIGLTIAIVLFLFVALPYMILGQYSWFAPKFADARRDVFEATNSYNRGKLQDLANYHLQYVTASSQGEKDAIKATVRHMFADYNDQNMDPELGKWLKEMRGF